MQCASVYATSHLLLGASPAAQSSSSASSRSRLVYKPQAVLSLTLRPELMKPIGGRTKCGRIERCLVARHGRYGVPRAFEGLSQLVWRYIELRTGTYRHLQWLFSCYSDLLYSTVSAPLDYVKAQLDNHAHDPSVAPISAPASLVCFSCARHGYLRGLLASMACWRDIVCDLCTVFCPQKLGPARERASIRVHSRTQPEPEA